MNKIEEIKSKYPGYYMNNVPSHYRWSKENINKYNKNKEFISKYSKEDIIEFAKRIESLENNIDKMLGLLL